MGGQRCVPCFSDPGVTAPGCGELCSLPKNVCGLSAVRQYARCHLSLDTVALQGRHELQACSECLRICIPVWLCACLRGSFWRSQAGWFAGVTVASVSRGNGRSVLLPCLQSWHVCMSRLGFHAEGQRGCCAGGQYSCLRHRRPRHRHVYSTFSGHVYSIRWARWSLCVAHFSQHQELGWNERPRDPSRRDGALTLLAL